MQGAIIVGKQTTYTILRHMPFSWDEKVVYYFCRDERGEHVLLYVCLADKEPKNLGKYLFLLRNYCLHNNLLDGHIGHESWFPIVDEVTTIPMGFSEKRGLVLRLDVKNVNGLVPLVTILKSKKNLSVLTIFWLMRELTLALRVMNALGVFVGLYSGGILISPEERRVVIYDFAWITEPNRENAYDVKTRQWSCLTAVCWEMLGFDDGSKRSYHEYEFIGEYDDNLLYKLGSFLSYGRDDLDNLSMFMREITSKFSVDEYPFILQDEPVLQTKAEEEPDEDELDDSEYEDGESDEDAEVEGNEDDEFREDE